MTYTFYVLFRAPYGDGWPWWLGWLLRWMGDCGHCSVLFKCPHGGQWVYVDYSIGGLAVYALAGTVELDAILADLGRGVRGYQVLAYTTTPTYDQFRLSGVLTCVSAVKAVLGVRAWRVLTPRQLRGWLLENNARVLPHHDEPTFAV